MNKNWMIPVYLVFILVTGQAVCAAQAGTSGGAKVAVPASSANAAPSTSGTAPQFQQRDPRYKIAASDSFDLTFPLSPEYNQLAVTVQPDGFVTLYGVGDVKVQGLTIPELTETLRRSYIGILHDPIISIVLRISISRTSSPMGRWVIPASMIFARKPR